MGLWANVIASALPARCTSNVPEMQLWVPAKIKRVWHWLVAWSNQSWAKDTITVSKQPLYYTVYIYIYHTYVLMCIYIYQYVASQANHSIFTCSMHTRPCALWMKVVANDHVHMLARVAENACCKFPPKKGHVFLRKKDLMVDQVNQHLRERERYKLCKSCNLSPLVSGKLWRCSLFS